VRLGVAFKGTGFVRHYGRDVNYLLAEVDRLTAENAAMKSMLESRGFTVVNGQWARTEETV
jgi:hypothetical protein